MHLLFIVILIYADGVAPEPGVWSHYSSGAQEVPQVLTDGELGFIYQDRPRRRFGAPHIRESVELRELGAIESKVLDHATQLAIYGKIWEHFKHPDFSHMEFQWDM